MNPLNFHHHLVPQVPPFLDQIFSDLSRLKIDVQSYELDHLCYRVDSVERFEQWKTALAAVGELLIESMIGGRLIATFKLHHPLLYQGRKIFCIELPSPKKSQKVYAEGLEHVEFVIDQPFDQFMDQYPHVTFDTSAICKNVNPDIRIYLSSGYSVKFHHQSLEKIISLEKEIP